MIEATALRMQEDARGTAADCAEGAEASDDVSPPEIAEPPKGSLQTVSADYEIDLDARYTGKVAFYSKLKGFGFIDMDQQGIVPEDKLFVQWRNIDSNDRFPFLVTGHEVEFSVTKWKDAAHNGEVTLRARAVSTLEGGRVEVQDEIDSSKKTFVGPPGHRYAGNLKFYNPKNGYGYIEVDADSRKVAAQGEEGLEFASQLRVERSEVNAGGKQPQWMQNVAVEFGIWKTSRDVPKAYDVTLPGGLPLTQEALENRQLVGGQTYLGEVTLWNMSQGWGFIRADSSMPLPPHVQARLTQQTKVALQRAAARGKHGSEEELLYVRKTDVREGVQLDKGFAVMFKLYVDDKGVGACDVQAI